MTQHKDSQGVVIEEGQRVAYNRSGGVVPGLVVDASSRGHVKIRCTSNRPNYSNYPTISVVKADRSILVLVLPGVIEPAAGANSVPRFGAWSGLDSENPPW